MRGALIAALAGLAVGAGHAAAAPAPPPPNLVTLGPLQAADGVATAPVAAVIQAKGLAGLGSCFRHALDRQPLLALSGSGSLTLSISAGGRVSKVIAHSDQPALSVCWKAAASTWRFGKTSAPILVSVELVLDAGKLPENVSALRPDVIRPPPPPPLTGPPPVRVRGAEIALGTVVSGDERLIRAQDAQNVIAKNLAPLKACYLDHVTLQRDRAGTAWLKVQLNGHGMVGEVDVTGIDDPDLKRCFRDSAMKWALSHLAHGKPVRLTVPISFKPTWTEVTGPGTRPSNPGIGPIPGPTEDTPPQPQPIMLFAITKVESSDETDLPSKPTERKVQGYIGGLKLCYARLLKVNPVFAGKGKLELIINAQGRVSEVNVSGVADASLQACFASAPKNWRFPPMSGDQEPTLTVSIAYQPYR